MRRRNFGCCEHCGKRGLQAGAGRFHFQEGPISAGSTRVSLSSCTVAFGTATVVDEIWSRVAIDLCGRKKSIELSAEMSRLQEHYGIRAGPCSLSGNVT